MSAVAVVLMAPAQSTATMRLPFHPRAPACFACPHCGNNLVSNTGSHGSSQLVCANRHAFDVAKEGHVNLLPPTRSKPGVHDEVDKVVRASRAFHENGGFASQAAGIAAEVTRALCECPDAGGSPQILAAGCGEGFYVRTLGKQLDRAGLAGQVGLWGTDTSKLAVRYAAKKPSSFGMSGGRPLVLTFARNPKAMMQPTLTIK